MGADDAIEEWLMEIRDDPEMYYADYVALCKEKKIRPFSPNAWADLCRS